MNKEQMGSIRAHSSTLLLWRYPSTARSKPPSADLNSRCESGWSLNVDYEMTLNNDTARSNKGGMEMSEVRVHAYIELFVWKFYVISL
jgi:hypothetical protein